MSTPDPGPSQLVRPYALTRGRTAPTRDYPLEALVRTHLPVLDDSGLSPEERSIIDLCRQSRSVAEVAALVRIPLGVARILIGDLVDRGVVSVHVQTESDSAPDATLLERVLSGLRKL
ncbi:DUF742 domain-containing protein [Agromyces larvae]|uniref:DUF742 domain-containing protein n=1 Tax=Agromyces larvae TaxID=2929802 RepID=A0ABY4BY05_9MICO|nr:DUF742 domain-containing protein [Agromyces larvae]UOE44043.1 DUF742 domain-containing protein [Agromyces larvae]